VTDEPRHRREAIYDRLYRQWEESRWSATAIDFSVDASHWLTELTDRQREAAMWNYGMFLKGVEVEARVLSALMDAVAGRPQALFLATQIADESRNRVFLDRFMREVAGQGHDPQSTSEAIDHHLTWGFRQTFEELERIAGALRRHADDRALLTQAVALCHVIIEGVLAIPGEHFIHAYVNKRGIMPGFASGLGHIAHDEARHVNFGMAFLSRLIESRENRSAALQMWNRVLPSMVGVFIPPNLDHSYVECFDFKLEEIYAFGLRTLETKTRELGVDPSELYLVSLDDRSLTYEQRAHRLIVLIEAGILGDNRREPRPSQEAMEILFDATARAIDLDVARSLEGPVEWSFTDTEPWHIVVTDDHAEAKLGRAGDPALKLEMAAGDWARVAVGRSDARWALLKRRLRVHGHWQAKAKLSRLFAGRSDS
jgi:ribonucleoside-diphosphate reductase beta chain